MGDAHDQLDGWGGGGRWLFFKILMDGLELYKKIPNLHCKTNS
jgi:hypothetical protein